ncbi:hypothetical protein [Mycolicibacterium psychrotolerans]|uniref:Uncharacterized protein n=1 Tax=Mycolicibacterium psychrotolerans TaxID=216929 RepID=A0A7I7MC92_9MYCO|nr:hypothetical protein [Mycolicibacterium psychrotolerans]BBX69407.1 hypothetical protein MPSYJ_28680 [Mycolicibacterium psychrotolerans]
MSHSTPFEDLPESWRDTIKELRRENAKMRHQRNEAREALAELALKVASQ